MAEQRLIDGNCLHAIESLLNTDIVQNSSTASWLMGQVLHDIKAQPTIHPEDLPIVRQLRKELKQYKDLDVTPGQIALLMKFFRERTSTEYIVANMGLVADLLRKNELENQLAQVTAERDAAEKDRAALADFELALCEQFCFGDGKRNIPPCEWCVDGKCKLREWRGSQEGGTQDAETD